MNSWVFALRVPTVCWRGLLLCAVGLWLAGCATPLPTTVRTTVPPGVALSGPDSAASTPSARVPRKSLKLGLALGGGGARGFAHVGVIQVLEEAGIHPQLVVGTSVGSMVAAFYAAGRQGAQLQKLAENMEEWGLTDWNLPLMSRGLIKGKNLANYVATVTGGKRIEDLPLPLGIVATDLKTGQGVLFQRGDVATAVWASSAVPAVFEPVRISGRDYVDGGLVSPVPVRYARQMGADIVLAVDISSSPETNQASGIVQLVLQTFTIMGQSIKEFELREAEVVVKPPLDGVGSASFGERQRSIQAGRLAMLQALPELRRFLEP
jgi:NTE family protein